MINHGFVILSEYFVVFLSLQVIVRTKNSFQIIRNSFILTSKLSDEKVRWRLDTQ